MTSTSAEKTRIRRFDQEAYRFIYEALHFTQQKLHRGRGADKAEDHITGQELAHGARELGVDRYGLLAKSVFRHWGIHSTADFGRIVFDLIERGEMRKTERDQLSDFYDVFDFDEALDRTYKITLPAVD